MKRIRSLLFIAAALVTAQTAVLAQDYDDQYPQPYRGDGERQAAGVIAFVNGTHLQLRDGRNIFLKDGTQINPTGITLQPGMLIFVFGVPGGNGAINAARIDVQHRDNNYYDNGRRETIGVITLVNGSHIQLEDGRNIFLKDGTVINPTGATLQVGQQIFVQGTPGGNGAINATRINIQRPGYYFR